MNMIQQAKTCNNENGKDNLEGTESNKHDVRKPIDARASSRGR
jgi:hypothetical protein